MMEVTKVVTSVFVLCLSGPTFGYPFTRTNLFSGVPAGGAGEDRGQGPTQLEHHLLPGHLEDYLANYVQSQGSQQYPQYQQQQPAYYQQQQGPYQQTKLTAETLAALLPYLSSSRLSDDGSAGASSNDYAYPDYPVAGGAGQAYTDDEGTWYDEMANAAYQPTQQEEEQAALRLLLDHLNGRYSLDDLEAMEREAEMEENTESQLQSLMNKKVRRHEIMNDFGQGDDQHLTIRKLRETVGVKRSEGEKEHFGDDDDGGVMDDVEKELKEQDSNTKGDDSQDSASGVVSQDEKSSTHSTGLRKRSWGQTIGHLSFWGPNRYRSHRLHRGDIGHIKFMSPF